MNRHFSDELFIEIEKTGMEGKNYFSSITRKFKNIMPSGDKKILDVGCGTGLFFCELASSEDVELIGLDTLSDSNKIAVARGYKKVMDIDDLSSQSFPFGANEFDALVCKDVFEHLLEPKFALSEIYRVLKPGGMFLVHVPNHFSLYGRLKFLFFNRIDTFNYFKSDDRWTYPHVRFFEYQGFKETIERNDFVLITDLSYQFPAIPFLSRFTFVRFIVYPFLKKFPSQLCAGITIIFQKRFDK